MNFEKILMEAEKKASDAKIALKRKDELIKQELLKKRKLEQEARKAVTAITDEIIKSSNLFSFIKNEFSKYPFDEKKLFMEDIVEIISLEIEKFRQAYKKRQENSQNAQNNENQASENS